MNCTNCGKEMDVNWNVCPECGTIVERKSVDENDAIEKNKGKQKFSFESTYRGGIYCPRRRYITSDVEINADAVHIITKRGRKKNETTFSKQDIRSFDFSTMPIVGVSDVIRIVIFSLLMFLTFGLSIFAVLFSIKVMLVKNIRLSLRDGRRIVIPIYQKADACEFLKAINCSEEIVCDIEKSAVDRKKVLLKDTLITVILFVLAVVGIGLGCELFGTVLVTGIDDSETKPSTFAEEEILDKLQVFTTVYKGEDKYYFLDNGDKWVLTYTSENEFVSFENDTVIKCFTDAFGEGCFSEGSVSDLGFSYDLSDNEARIYFDVDIEDGHLTIVSYNLSDQEYELMLDGEKWTTTDVFTDYVEEYGLAESIEKDVKEFKDLLQQHELTVDDLLKVKYDTLESQFVPDMEETKNEEKQDVNEENTEATIDDSLGWKKVYLDYLNEIGNTEYGYSLDYIDGDDIPELVIDYMIAAEGVYLCTYDGESVIATPVGESLRYRLKENLFCVSGGRMDYYYDIIYEIVDGVPKEVSKGEYGILDYENVKYDESGAMIYQYSWNGESISEYDYYDLTENFSYEEYPNIVCPAGRGYFYDIVEVLEHPLDIVTINPYLNNNGYESLLSHYVVLFDGIEGDKIHFSVIYNDELVGSASATIIDSKTAEYRNDKSDLVIKFDVDYQRLEIEGYMNTIDLTGSYMGRWG